MPDYLITTTIPNDGTPATRERIVRAKNQAQAIRHVVTDTMKVEVADTDDAMRIARNGGDIEIAKEEA